MKDCMTVTQGIQELTIQEVEQVSGAGRKASTNGAVTGGAALGAAAAIGAATWGSTWGVVGAGAAFAAAPIAVVGMGMLVAWGAYSLWSSF